MQYELFDDFKDGMVMTAIPLSWFKRVTEFIKNFGGGGVVKVRTENGTPNVTMDVSISQKDDINTEMKPYKDEEGVRVTDSPFDGDGENTVSWGINEENANDKNGCIVTLPTRFVHPKKTVEGEQVDDKSKIRMFFRSFAKSPSGITAAVTREIGYKDFCSIKPNDDSTVLEADGEADAGSSDDAARADHVHPLNVADSGAPSDVVKSTGTASLGDDDTYARTDHVHKMPELAATDITYSTTTVDAKLTNHGERITALEQGGGGGAVTSVNGKTGAVVLDADDVGALDSEDIGSTVQAYSKKLSGVQSYINDDNKVLLSGIQGDISGHTGNCLVTINDSGALSHSGNKAYTLIDDASDSEKNATMLITDKDIGGSLKINTENLLDVKCKSGGGIEVDDDGGLKLGDGAVLYDPDDIPTNAILEMDSTGKLTSACDFPTTASTTDDKVLTIKKNGLALSWEKPSSGQGTKTTPTATKGISVHGEYPALADFYDYPDRAAHPTDPAIVYPAWQARLDLPSVDGAEHAPPGRMTGADNTTPVGWERGKTAWKNGHDVDASHPAVGCSMTVCTHMRQVTISGTAKYQAIFSRMEFDENGLLVRVVPCSNWFTMM